jgi:hypothetical protein
MPINENSAIQQSLHIKDNAAGLTADVMLILGQGSCFMFTTAVRDSLNSVLLKLRQLYQASFQLFWWKILNIILGRQAWAWFWGQLLIHFAFSLRTENQFVVMSATVHVNWR